MYEEVRHELGEVRRESEQRISQIEGQMEQRMQAMLQLHTQQLSAQFMQEMDRLRSQIGSHPPPPLQPHPARTGESQSQAVDQDVPANEAVEEFTPEDLGRP